MDGHMVLLYYSSTTAAGGWSVGGPSSGYAIRVLQRSRAAPLTFQYSSLQLPTDAPSLAVWAQQQGGWQCTNRYSVWLGQLNLRQCRQQRLLYYHMRPWAGRQAGEAGKHFTSGPAWQAVG